MAVNPSPLGPKPQYELADGTPAVGYKLFFYVAGSVNTKQNTYTDSTGSVANANPIVLNALGQPTTQIWFTAGQSYKVVYAPSTDTDPPTSPVWTIDNISGINDVTVSQSEWVSGPAPTYVSATSFTLVGDQTSTFTKGRRVKTTNSGGTVYSTITNTAFAAVTTVTVANDTGSLDSGLSAVSYGLLSAVNPVIDSDMVYRKGAAVASAATTDIWGIAGDFVHVTGVVTITSLGTAPYAGAERTVIFDGALVLTQNATSLILPGATNIFTAAGDRATVRADTTANMIVTSYVRSSGLPPVGTSLPRSYLAGLTLSSAGGSATMTIAAGQAIDGTNTVVMNLANSLAKTTSAWAVGAAGGLDTGAIANTTWYHFWLITRVDTGVVDVLISLSATAPTMPASYTLKRRIGSGKTDGSAQWIAFIQDGDYFRWAASVLDVNTNAPGTAAVTSTLTVPTGINVYAVMNAGVVMSGDGSSAMQVSDLAITDETPVNNAAPLYSQGFSQNVAAAGVAVSSVVRVMERTNTSAQIRYRCTASSANVNARIATLGWYDRRGRDA